MTHSMRRQCNSEFGPKWKNETIQDAERQLESLVVNRGAIREKYQIFECSTCGFWHVGHKTRKRTRRERKSNTFASA